MNIHQILQFCDFLFDFSYPFNSSIVSITLLLTNVWKKPFRFAQILEKQSLICSCLQALASEGEREIFHNSLAFTQYADT